MSGDPAVFTVEPLGIGNGWRLSSEYELQLNPMYFPYEGKASILSPNGSSYDFQKQNSTILTKIDDDANQINLKLEFEGEWPSDLQDFLKTPSLWKLTLADNSFIRFKTYPIQGMEAENSSNISYNIGRPVEIVHPDGYSQTFTYDEYNALSSIEDNYGRKLKFTWIMQEHTIRDSTNVNKSPLAISRIDLPDGNAISYKYGMLSGSQSNLAIPLPERLEQVMYLDTKNTIIGQRTYHYENQKFPFYMTGITDERGQRIASWSYDDRGRAISSEGADGLNHFTVSYDDTDGAESTTVMNPLGKKTTYHFNRIGFNSRGDAGGSTMQLQKIQSEQTAASPASTSSIKYDNRGFIEQRTDEAGNKTHYTYNNRGLLESLVEGVGTAEKRTTTIVWHPLFNQPIRVIEAGRETTNIYTAKGLLTSHTIKDTIRNQTRTTTYSYTPNGQLKTINGSRTDVNDITTYSYDTVGNLRSVTNPLRHKTQITAHDGAGRPLRVVDPNGVIVQLKYDARGHLIQAIRNNAKTQLTYDLSGNLLRITQPDGGIINYRYDASSRLTKIADALGNWIQYTLDQSGNRITTKVVDSTGVLRKTQRSIYDDIDQLLQLIGSQNDRITRFAYDKLGNIKTQTDALNQTTNNSYDTLSRLTQVGDAQQGITRYAYDAANNLTAITDPRGNITRYTYNAFGEQLQEISPDRGTLKYIYDAAGNRTSQTDARGVITRYRYDALNRLIAIQYPNSSLNISFAYDQGKYGKGKLTKMQNSTGVTAYGYDAQGNLVLETLTTASQTWTTAYSYDLANQLVGITYPSGRSVKYLRNQAGNITKVTSAQQGKTSVLADAIAYLPFGPEISRRFGNGLIETQTYDLDYRLGQLATTPVLNFTYTYDLINNIRSIGDNITPARSQSFAYDALSRLTQASGSYGQLGYGYDAVGNRLKKTDGSKTENYTYAANGNRLLGRDGGLGEPVKAIVSVYGDHNRLSKVTVDGQNTTYQYNGKGERVSKTHNGVTTRYHYDQEGHLIAESQGNTITAEYIYLNDEPLAFVSQDAATQPISYVHTDHLGTPKALTNARLR
jgi:YD repeat-containing protein